MLVFFAKYKHPVPTDKGKTVSFVLCSPVKCGIPCRPPVEVPKKLHALCKT